MTGGPTRDDRDNAARRRLEQTLSIAAVTMAIAGLGIYLARAKLGLDDATARLVASLLLVTAIVDALFARWLGRTTKR
jgi:hypothetical protein